jgi:hypothetical protein
VAPSTVMVISKIFKTKLLSGKNAIFNKNIIARHEEPPDTRWWHRGTVGVDT